MNKPRRWKHPSARDFERAYDRALALKENGYQMTPEKWAKVVEEAKGFVGSLNDKGWTFSGYHYDLPQEEQELGEVSMALAAAQVIAKDKHDPHWRVANMILKAIDSLGQ
jgi:hypothetical protein